MKLTSTILVPFVLLHCAGSDPSSSPLATQEGATADHPAADLAQAWGAAADSTDGGTSLVTPTPVRLVCAKDELLGAPAHVPKATSALTVSVPEESAKPACLLLRAAQVPAPGESISTSFSGMNDSYAEWKPGCQLESTESQSPTWQLALCGNQLSYAANVKHTESTTYCSTCADDGRLTCSSGDAFRHRAIVDHQDQKLELGQTYTFAPSKLLEPLVRGMQWPWLARAFDTVKTQVDELGKVTGTWSVAGMHALDHRVDRPGTAGSCSGTGEDCDTDTHEFGPVVSANGKAAVKFQLPAVGFGKSQWAKGSLSGSAGSNVSVSMHTVESTGVPSAQCANKPCQGGSVRGTLTVGAELALPTSTVTTQALSWSYACSFYEMRDGCRDGAVIAVHQRPLCSLSQKATRGASF